MGGSGSVPLPRYSCCIRQQNPNRCKENHSSTPRVKGHRRNLSAAFNMADLDQDFSVEQIDINRAGEEELMTLPGINRLTAKNIVEYRRQIGGFKKVEDLALVSGVGANKLTNIRLEITVGSRKKSSQSQNSSPYSSKLELSSLQDDISRSSSKSQALSGRQNGVTGYQKVNINTSNVFHLMKVKGITQHLAENIVAYRDKKGPFRHLDDVVKVKGIKSALLSAIRPYLSLSEVNPPRTDTVYLNGSVHGTNINHTSHTDSIKCHVRSVSQAPLLAGASSRGQTSANSQEDLMSLYGPLARKSFRSVRRPVLFRKNNRHVVRMASWNLEDCGLDKASNPGVKEVFAMTVLENGLSVVAVQDLRHPDALEKLCHELNHPTVPNVKKWAGHMGSWKSVTSKSIGGASQGYVGFLYDVSRGIECRHLEVLEFCDNRGKTLDRRPCKAVFKVKDWEISVFCVDWEPHQPDTVLDDLLEAINDSAEGNRDVIILGNFGSEPTSKEFDVLRHKDYRCLLEDKKSTDVSTRHQQGSSCPNHIWIGQSTTQSYTKNNGVIRDGLSSPWIPNGWGWGGQVSRFHPIWAEFYMDLAAVTANAVPKLSEESPLVPLNRPTTKSEETEDDGDDDEFVDARDTLV